MTTAPLLLALATLPGVLLMRGVLRRNRVCALPSCWGDAERGEE